MKSPRPLGTDDTDSFDNAELPKSRAWPRWKSALIGAVGFPLAHGGLPWVIALLSRHYGWSNGHPGRWNFLGLILIVAGSVYAGWGLVLHTSEGWQWTRAQPYLLRRGPYRFSRNPMYVGELALWLGWAIFYGSVSVLLAWMLWWAAFVFNIVPGEERALEARYGGPFRQYKRTVPRWLGKARR